MELPAAPVEIKTYDPRLELKQLRERRNELHGHIAHLRDYIEVNRQGILDIKKRSESLQSSIQEMHGKIELSKIELLQLDRQIEKVDSFCSEERESDLTDKKRKRTLDKRDKIRAILAELESSIEEMDI